MKVLGVDYGDKFIGLSYSEGILAVPLTQLAKGEALNRITNICSKLEIDLCVIGIPQGRMEKKAKEFGLQLKNNWSGGIVFWDETLTSYSAQKLLIKSGKRGKNLKNTEHKVAASLMLQSYLDNQKN